MEIRKTPFRRTAAAALACLLLSLCPGAATGADTSRENCTAERLSHSNIMVLMVECDVDWNDIVKELANRRKS